MTVLVLGAAVSGRAAADLLTGLDFEVAGYDASPEAVKDWSIEPAWSGEWRDRYLDDVELVVTSPGIPPHAVPIADALDRGVPVWSELELAARHLAVPIVAVTGTNGKTTVTEMAADMLTRSGVRTSAAGNIGTPLSTAVGADLDVVVVEASSFQLRFVDAFHPRAAGVVNVAPDHLDWHGDFDAYLAAKARIHERMTSDEVVAFDSDDAGAVRATRDAVARLSPVSAAGRPHGGSGPDGGKLWIEDASIDLDDLVSTDASFLTDLMVAGTVALEVGASPEAVADVGRSFTPGSHRRTMVGTIDGVSYVDDSKATNPHAAIASTRAFSSVVLVAGGRNKGLDLSGLARQPSVKHVIGMGEAGPDVVRTASSGELADSMEEAVRLAAARAVAGDTVLLAPGCASFDMYDSYRARGDAFAAAVADLEGGR